MKRIKTGNWRPFRPAGMSDGMWQTILLLHRFPSNEMDEEEQSHCLGPKLFGKGGARFSDYGRGWIQEEADQRAASHIEDIWYRICYGPFGVGPWHVLTKLWRRNSKSFRRRRSFDISNAH